MAHMKKGKQQDSGHSFETPLLGYCTLVLAMACFLLLVAVCMAASRIVMG